MNKHVMPVLRPLLYVVMGLVFGCGIAAFAGENPWNVFEIMVVGIFGTPYDMGLTIYYATILICTGLAVALPFRAGVFNIGGEGQVVIGAMTCGALAMVLRDQVSSPIAAMVGIAGAFLGGLVWGAIAGWIRAWRGGHEVISSIMLNFIAAGFTGWLTLNYFRAEDSQNPETELISEVWRWVKWERFDGAPVTWLSLVVLVLAVIVWFTLRYTSNGFKIKAVQQTPEAANISGISVSWVRFSVLALGGGLAGIAGAVMVLGEVGRFRMEMSDGFGFMGIPVALLGKGHPIGVVASAILFAMLHHGASALDLEATYVNRDLAQVIQAFVVVVVVAENLFRRDHWQNFKASVLAWRKP